MRLLVKWIMLLFATILTIVSSDENRTIDKTIDNKNGTMDIKREIVEDFDLSQEMMSRQLELDEAVLFAIKETEDLINEKEPQWYQMGLILDKNHPASFVSKFGAPTKKALKLSRFGYVALEATKKIAEKFPENVGRESGFPEAVQSRLLLDECPLRGRPRCTTATKRYRTADGTCNNPDRPWRGSAMLPMQRFLPPVYEDGIQSIRRSVFNRPLPSARTVSTRIHRDKNREIQSVTLMFMQWGQFIDHDVTSIVKSRSFNGSIPRCCERGGRGFLRPELMHPACLPIKVGDDDWFLSRFRVRCMEFLRSAPSTRIDCDLGWREQINQVTPYIDASTIYGSDIETSDSIRTFRNGKLIYGRHSQGPLNPPDPPDGELCRSGAITSDCFHSGDGRSDEQPGLTALHTVWVRYHNKLATILSKLNGHWSDEKIFQETRKIVYSSIQHITYREFLPIVLGQEVMELFELNLVRKGFFDGFDGRVEPQIANSFGTAAYRFGHSMVQNSYVRADGLHRPLLNNVSLHEDLENFENIWAEGSLDRLVLGFLNQPSQRRDEFICDELTNHLFQFSGAPFGMDLAAINIQRGRDHGLPPYTAWREPCGLEPVKNWKDLEEIMSFETAQRLKSIYEHVDDIDLYSGGLAEKPLRGGIVGPTFACIIAQQFVNLRKGDRFWYENGNFESSFTPAQLQQIRHITLAQVLCQTLDGIETIQPFVFLSHDNFKNIRVPCGSPLINDFDLSVWAERDFKEVDNKLDFGEKMVEGRAKRKISNCTTTSNKRTVTTTKRPITTKTTKKKPKRTQPPLKIPIVNVTTTTVKLENKLLQRPNLNTYGIPEPNYDDSNDVTYLVGLVSQKTTPMPKRSNKRTEKPLELNIKIQYFLPTTTTKKPKKIRTKRPTYVQQTNDVSYPVFVQQNAQNVHTKPITIYDRPYNDIPLTSYVDRPINQYNRPINTYNDRPSINSYNDRPPINSYNDRPSINSYNDRPLNDRPTNSYNDRPYDIRTTTKRTYVIRPTSYYDNYGYQSQYDQSPFYTTEKPYRPQQDLYQYDKNTYNYDTHRIDPISDVYSHLLVEGHSHIPMKPTFGQLDDKLAYNKLSNKPNKIYSTAHIQKLDDKLDFKTKLLYDDDSDGRYVKISSVKSDQMTTKTKNKFIHTIQSKEGDFDLDQFTDPMTKTLRLVEIEVSPSDDQWTYFNATDEEMPEIMMPDINEDISCSREVPKPIKKKNRKKQRHDNF